MAYFMPQADETTDGKDREVHLIALVVAPGTGNAEIARSLRKHIDPVFIPRRLYMVNALSRNSMGKLPYQSLESMIQCLCAAQNKT